MLKRAVQCQPHDSVRCFRVKSKCPQPSRIRAFLSYTPPLRRPPEVHSSSSSEQYESSGNNLTYSKNEKSHKHGRRASSPTDSDDDNPFHFDDILASSPTKRFPTKRGDHDDGRSRAFSTSLLRRASIVPVDPTAEPAPHRFSLLREHASEETIFVQEICDAEGRRWSLRVPASGLPEDMVHMLEELEKLAVELGQALPRIVVTCSAESLSMKRVVRDAAAVNLSSELLRPPPAIGDESSVGYDAGTGLSLAKEKHRIRVVDLEHRSEEPGARSAVASSSSERSLTCIYLPEVSCHNYSLNIFIELLSSSRPSSYQVAQLLLSYSPQTVSTASQHKRSNARANAPFSQHSRNPNRRAASQSV